MAKGGEKQYSVLHSTLLGLKSIQRFKKHASTGAIGNSKKLKHVVSDLQLNGVFVLQARTS